MEHKALIDRLSKSDMKFAYNILRCINGEFYDHDMHQISRAEAINLCYGEKGIIVKDARDSSGGKGIEKYEPDKDKNIFESEINRIFDIRNGDFVVQRYLVQSEKIKMFNPSSVNTFRITTLYLNGKFSVLSSVLRMGKGQSIVDNLGSGGIIVGVNDDGSFKEFGYDYDFMKFNSNNEVKFKDTKIAEIPEILNILEKEHTTNFSMSKLIGWDIALDENNQPVVIEINSSQPGLIGEQLCSGPIFGDRTQEVIDYCMNKRFKYNRSLFNY